MRAQTFALCLPLLLGCAFSNTTSSIELRGAQPTEPVRQIIISDFYEGKYETSTTNSVDIIQLREAIGIRDISYDIAKELSALGYKTKAAVRVNPENLAPGDILIRGAVINTGWMPKAGFWIMSLPTLFVVGTILPYPVPIRFSLNYKYRVEIISASGEILSSQEDVYQSSYRTFSMWGVLAKSDKDKPDREALKAELASAIDEYLRVKAEELGLALPPKKTASQ